MKLSIRVRIAAFLCVFVSLVCFFTPAAHAMSYEEFCQTNAAESNPNPEVIALLLKNTDKENVSHWYNLGEKPESMNVLMVAAKSNPNPKCVEVILESGLFDVNKANYGSNKTALMFATKSNPNPEVVVVLLKNDADGEVKDASGRRQ
jgi:hypothetical protein